MQINDRQSIYKLILHEKKIEKLEIKITIIIIIIYYLSYIKWIVKHRSYFDVCRISQHVILRSLMFVTSMNIARLKISIEK